MKEGDLVEFTFNGITEVAVVTKVLTGNFEGFLLAIHKGEEVIYPINKHLKLYEGERDGDLSN
jgi:hypothetical protein